MQLQKHIQRAGRDLASAFPASWESLSRLGQSRALRSSYLWFIIVPIAARALQNVNEFHIPAFGHDFRLNLNMPFSWRVFYAGALFFGIASLTYSLACPRIIRNFEHAADFQKAGYGMRAVYLHALDVLYETMWVGNKESVTLWPWLREYQEKYYDDKTKKNPTEWKDHKRRWFATAAKEDQVAAAFFDVREVANYSRKVSRWICTVCYTLGFAASGWVIFQNAVFVLSGFQVSL